MAKILLVDDNPYVHRVVQEVLATDGHEVVGFFEGGDLLGRALEAQPDVLLLDTGLLGIDKYEACGEILQNHDLERVQVVLLAGPLESINPDEANQKGIHAVLQKPLRASELTALADASPASPGKAVSPAENGKARVDALVQEALGQASARHSRAAIREHVEAAVSALTPTIVDRITDRLSRDLKNP